MFRFSIEINNYSLIFGPSRDQLSYWSRMVNDGTFMGALITSVVISIGWWVTTRNTLFQERRERAHSSIVHFDDKAKKHFSVLRDHEMLEKSAFPPVGDAFYKTREGAQVHESIRYILSEFERLAVDVRYGVIMEKYVVQFQGGILCDFFTKSASYIDSARREPRFPDLYRNYEIFYNRIILKNRGIVINFWEFISMRPSFGVFELKIRFYYRIYRIFYSIKPQKFDKADQEYIRFLNKWTKAGYLIFALVGLSAAWWSIGQAMRA